MKNVIVIGSSGAGKFGFSSRPGEITGLPVIHLDKHHWCPAECWQLDPFFASRKSRQER